MKNRKYLYKNIRRNCGLNNGVTLLEVLLYIGIFTTLCISIIFLYTSILKTSHSIKIHMERAEVGFFIYEIARYKLDTKNQDILAHVSDPLKVEDFARVLKYYPNLSMAEISTEYITESDADFSNPFEYQKVKVTYKLIFKGVNDASKKTFSHTFYIHQL